MIGIKMANHSNFCHTKKLHGSTFNFVALLQGLSNVIWSLAKWLWVAENTKNH
jgi:hypothetical protein